MMARMGGERTFRRLTSAPRNRLILLMSTLVAKILTSAPLETRGSATFWEVGIENEF